MDNLKWTIRRNWQRRECKTQDEDKQNKQKKTQYVLDTTIRKQTKCK